MHPAEVLAVLRQAHFLRDVEDQELQDLAASLPRETCAPGQEIARQGTLADALFLILSGRVELERREPERPPRSVAVLGPGDTFGEMEILGHRAFRASARALEPTQVLRWERRALMGFLQEAPSALASLRFTARTRERTFRRAFRWLEPGEVVHGLTGKHPIVLYRGLFLPAALLAVAAGLGSAALAGSGSALGWMAGAVGLVGAALGLWQWIDWANDDFLVTDRRVVWLEKVIGLYDSREEAPLRMVQSVSVSTEIIGRMLDYGDVVIRTYTGEVLFRSIPSPYAMAAIIEEHWRRTQDQDQQADRASIVETLQQRLGSPSPPPAPTPARPGTAAETERAPRDIGLDRWHFRVRFEERGVITYRKHWAVLLRATFLPSLWILLAMGVLGARLGGLLQSLPEGIALVGPLAALIPLALWWLYQFADWANDVYQVTGDQIIDIHKKPLAREVRKVAPLENILGTEVDRKGLIGILLNYGDVVANVGTTQFVFQGVFDPAGVQHDIVRSQEAFLERKREAERSRRRDEMVEWLGAYHQEFSPRDRREPGRGADRHDHP